jgi:hypothetical protein
MAVTTAALTAALTGYGITSELSKTPTGQTVVNGARETFDAAKLRTQIGLLTNKVSELQNQVNLCGVEAVKVEADGLKKRLLDYKSEVSVSEPQKGGFTVTRSTSTKTLEQQAIINLKQGAKEIRDDIAAGKPIPMNPDYKPYLDMIVNEDDDALVKNPPLFNAYNALYSKLNTGLPTESTVKDLARNVERVKREISRDEATSVERAKREAAAPEEPASVPSSGAPTPVQPTNPTPPSPPQPPAPEVPAPEAPPVEAPAPAPVEVAAPEVAPEAVPVPPVEAPAPAPEPTAPPPDLTGLPELETDHGPLDEIDTLIDEVDTVVANLTQSPNELSKARLGLREIERKFRILQANRTAKRVSEKAEKAMSGMWSTLKGAFASKEDPKKALQAKLTDLNTRAEVEWARISQNFASTPVDVINKLVELRYTIRVVSAELDKERIAPSTATQAYEEAAKALDEIAATVPVAAPVAPEVPAPPPEVPAPTLPGPPPGPPPPLPLPPPLTVEMKREDLTNRLTDALADPAVDAEYAPALSALQAGVGALTADEDFVMRQRFVDAVRANDVATVTELAPTLGVSVPTPAPAPVPAPPPPPAPARTTVLHDTILRETPVTISGGRKAQIEADTFVKTIKIALERLTPPNGNKPERFRGACWLVLEMRNVIQNYEAIADPLRVSLSKLDREFNEYKRQTRDLPTVYDSEFGPQTPTTPVELPAGSSLTGTNTRLNEEYQAAMRAKEAARLEAERKQLQAIRAGLGGQTGGELPTLIRLKAGIDTNSAIVKSKVAALRREGPPKKNYEAAVQKLLRENELKNPTAIESERKICEAAGVYGPPAPPAIVSTGEDTFASNPNPLFTRTGRAPSPGASVAPVPIPPPAPAPPPAPTLETCRDYLGNRVEIGDRVKLGLREGVILAHAPKQFDDERMASTRWRSFKYGPCHVLVRWDDGAEETLDATNLEVIPSSMVNAPPAPSPAPAPVPPTRLAAVSPPPAPVQGPPAAATLPGRGLFTNPLARTTTGPVRPNPKLPPLSPVRPTTLAPEVTPAEVEALAQEAPYQPTTQAGRKALADFEAAQTRVKKAKETLQRTVTKGGPRGGNRTLRKKRLTPRRGIKTNGK